MLSIVNRHLLRRVIKMRNKDRILDVIRLTPTLSSSCNRHMITNVHDNEFNKHHTQLGTTGNVKKLINHLAEKVNST